MASLSQIYLQFIIYYLIYIVFILQTVYPIIFSGHFFYEVCQ